MQKRTLTILAIATEWTSRHGGLSTVNRAVCVALARAGHTVLCLVPSASPEEVGDAQKYGVTLIQAATVDADSPNMELLRPARLGPGVIPDVIIGHGRITGPAAKAQVEDTFRDAARIHFVHVIPGEIEWFKVREKAAARAEDRELKEVRLCREADLVVAVGPRIYREVSTLLARLDHAPRVWRLDPPLITELPLRDPPAGIHILLMGRAEDFELKGLDIAARAVGQLLSRGLQPPPSLVIRGAPPDTAEKLREQLRAIAGEPVDIRVREYTADTERLTNDLRQASLVLLPSRAEGFGLVGLEAIGARVPVLVSDRSGLGEMLRSRLPTTDAASFVVKVTGDLETDASEWAGAMESVLRDRHRAIERVDRLAQDIAANHSWDAVAGSLLAALPKPSPPGQFLHYIGTSALATAPAHIIQSPHAVGESREDPTPRERLATAVRERNIGRARRLLNELAIGDSHDVQVLVVAIYALITLADLEDRVEERLKLRRQAISIAEKSWRRVKDAVFAISWAESAVNHFYDRFAPDEPDQRDKALRDAKQAIDEALKSLQDPHTKVELLSQKASLLGSQALVEKNHKRKQSQVHQRLRCAQLAVRVSDDAQQALLALGQAAWMAARWEDNYQQRITYLNKAERALRRAGGHDPISRLLLCRFLRLTHRPFQAIRAFIQYASIEPNVWRRLTESYLIGESALHLQLQGFDAEVVAAAARHARHYLQEAVEAGVGNARIYIALANVLALLGLDPDAAALLARLKRGSDQDWLVIVQDAMKSIEDCKSSELATAFVLGLDDPAVWNQLGSFASRFLRDPKLARHFWETGLRLDPSQPELLTNLARALTLSENKKDVIRASCYIDQAAHRADRTWRWWQPVRRTVDEARHRLGLPPLPPSRYVNKEWVAVEAALQTLRMTGSRAHTVLGLLASISPGIHLDGDLLDTGGVVLRVEVSESSVTLRDVGDNYCQLGMDDMASAVDGHLGLASVIDRQISHWPEFELSSLS